VAVMHLPADIRLGLTACEESRKLGDPKDLAAGFRPVWKPLDHFVS